MALPRLDALRTALLAHPRTGRGLRLAAVLLVGLLGAVAGLLIGGQVNHAVGPVDAHLSVRPALVGDTEVAVSPLGSLRLDSHDGPVRLDIRVTELRLADARRIFSDPGSLSGVGDRVAKDLKSALVALAIRSVISAVLGGVLLCLLVFRTRRATLFGGLTGLVVLAGAGGTAAATWNPESLAEPHYSGLLASAPAAVGDARNILARFDRYRDELAKLVTNVSKLYDVTSTLPAFSPDTSTIRVLHVSDIHDAPQAFDVINSISQQFKVDVIVDTGDLTDHATPPEDDQLAKLVAGLGRAYVYIRGNHDSLRTQQVMAHQPNVTVLDGDTKEVGGLRFFGVGDPRFTPDKTTRDDSFGDDALRRVGQKAADQLAATEPPPVDVALVHDPVEGAMLAGAVPLVLDGHTHHRDHHDLDGGTLQLVQGSTGGAGLRGLEGEKPTPLECSVLYFSRDARKLLAYDDITVGGLGLASVDITRHVVHAEEVSAPSPSPTGSAAALVNRRSVPYAF